MPGAWLFRGACGGVRPGILSDVPQAYRIGADVRSDRQMLPHEHGTLRTDPP